MPGEITNEDVYAKLTEIAAWLKFENLDKLRQLLIREVDTDQKKLVFENTDGEKGRYKVAELCSVPHTTIQGWWIKWRRLGILQQSPKYKDRLVKICSLDEVGLDVPKQIGVAIEKGDSIPQVVEQNVMEKQGA